MYCLDTNTCVFALKGRYASIGERLQALSPERVRIPSMVQAELLYGATRSLEPARTRSVIEAFLLPFRVLPFDSGAACVYGAIRASLEASGTPIGPNDLVIAATVLAHGGTLVTQNVREFARVPNLSWEDWTA